MAIVLALAIYVLSIGPAIRLALTGVIGESFIATTYKPLEFTAQHCRPLDLFLMWYIDKWRPPTAPTLVSPELLLSPPAIPQPALSSPTIPSAPLPKGLRPADEPLNARGISGL
jgi:hypothetical protein